MNLQRQSFLGPDSESRLQGAAAAIVGLCGGGSHVGQQLAHIGLGNFFLIDPDTADDTNINRMVGLTAKNVAARAPKTEVLKRAILGVNPSASVEVEAKKWQLCTDQLRDCHVIFGCVDSFSERDQLERFARRFLIPYIDVGMDVFEEEGEFFISGQTILSLPGQPCMRCMGFLTEDLLAKEAADYGAAGGKPQVVWPNGILASVAVGKFMALLNPWNSGMIPDFYMDYDGNRSTVTPSRKLKYLPATCTHFEGPDALGDLEW